MVHAAAVLSAGWAWSPIFCPVGLLKLTAVSSSSESKDSCVCEHEVPPRKSAPYVAL